jgi:hypothetical protein
MGHALGAVVERRLHVEDRHALLSGDDPPRGEVAAVAGALHLIDDRLGLGSGTDEIAVQRMHRPPLHRELTGPQRLSQDLAAVQGPAQVGFGAARTEIVRADILQVQEVAQRQVGQPGLGHQPVAPVLAWIMRQ